MPQLSSSIYKSVAALDQYGNSVQLQNAMESSSRYGTLLIAAIASSCSEIIVCSLYQPRLGVRCHPENGCAVHIIASEDDIDESSEMESSVTALVCSGVKADAELLLKILRTYSQKVWERYDCIATCERVSAALSEAYLSFMGYKDHGNDVTGNVPILDEDFDMSRPFGVRSLVLGIESGKARIRSVEPSGVQSSWLARALGKGSDEAQKMLEKMWRKEMSTGDVKDMCVEIIRDYIRREMNNGVNERAEIVCESLSSLGVKVERFPLKVTR